MKTKTSKEPKKATVAVRLKEMTPKKTAKGGTDNSTIYVRTAGSGVWKTKDGGRS